jgi:glutamate synthase domain-containing protein 3
MTGGVVVVLGSVGRNFGAGMTGGRAWLWDPADVAGARLDGRSVSARPGTAADTRQQAQLRDLLAAHAQAGSARAADLLARWPQSLREFRLVEPTAPVVVTVPAPPAARAVHTRPVSASPNATEPTPARR